MPEPSRGESLGHEADGHEAGVGPVRGAPELVGIVPVGGAFLDLLAEDLGGSPLLVRALDVLTEAGARQIVVVAPPGHLEEVRRTCATTPATVLSGGPGAVGTVLTALDAVAPPPDARVVLHTPEHVLVSARRVHAAVTALDEHGVDAVLTVTPVTDTVKRLGPAGRVVDTLDRERHRAVSSPQVYRALPLRNVVAAAAQAEREGLVVDALPGMCLSAGLGLATVEAPAGDLRVLTPAQLEIARTLLELGRGG